MKHVDRPSAKQQRLEAILYDWHNTLLLSRQNRDLQFWQEQLGNADSVCVMGAGTGRVAAALTGGTREVTMVDLSAARLQRAAEKCHASPLIADFCYVVLPSTFDHIVFPYSALQLVNQDQSLSAISNALNQLRPGGRVWLDLSDSFQTRPTHDWKEVLHDYCDELDQDIVEWQRGTRGADRFNLGKKFISPRGCELAIIEHWFFHDADWLAATLNDMSNCRWSTQRGYGNGQSRHRRIYQLQIR